MNADVLIVGAGVLGVSAAFHLSHLGKKVIVFEREQSFAMHASGKNAGMFRQLYRHPQLTDWAERSRLLWPEEVKQMAFKKTGSLIAGRKHNNHHSHLFTSRSLEFTNPSKNLPTVFTESDGLLDPHTYISRLMSLSNHHMLEFNFNTDIVRAEYISNLWNIKTRNGKTYQAPWIINAAGAWINTFLDEKLQLEAKAYARHLFVVKGFNPDFMPAPNCGFYWHEPEKWYMRHWDSESRLVSICEEIPANPDTFTPSGEEKESLAVKLLACLPESIAKNLCPGKNWFCFRTYTEDKLPIWGENPLSKGLFWLAAFGGFGMSTSFAASLDAARYIVGEKVKVSKDFQPRQRLISKAA